MKNSIFFNILKTENYILSNKLKFTLISFFHNFFYSIFELKSYTKKGYRIIKNILHLQINNLMKRRNIIFQNLVISFGRFVYFA